MIDLGIDNGIGTASELIRTTIAFANLDEKSTPAASNHETI